VLVAVGLVAGCTLALQVLLTRLFSAVLFYHFGFLAISLALLGLGAGAIAVYVRPGWFERSALEAVLARWCAGFTALLLLAPLVLVRLEFGFANEVTFGFVVKLGIACVVSALPFLAGGIVIAVAVKAYVRWIGRVYAFDLAGAAIGALAIVPLLWLLDAPTLIVGLGVVAAAATVLFAGPNLRELQAGAVLAGVAAVLVALSAATSLYYLEPQAFVSAGETQGLLPAEDIEPAADRWSPISRVVGYEPQGDGPNGFIFYDRDAAPVPRYERGDPHPDWRVFGHGPQSIGYELTGPGEVLIIGGGGGRDIHTALAAGQREVDVIELNRAIREVVDEDLGHFSGSPYSLPHVHSVAGDGRSTLAARDESYDQIHIGFTNTLSGSSAQAFALAEQNLYTVEAFEEYFDHLQPRGILNVSRLYRFVGEEALRATVLTLEALRRRGVDDPERHLVVVLGTDRTGLRFGTVLARLEPFSAAELARVRTLARERGGEVAFAAGGPYAGEWRGLAEAASPQEFCDGYALDVCPPTDDKPFFLHVTRLQDNGASTPFLARPTPFQLLLIVLAILLVLSVLAFVVPVLMVRDVPRPPTSSLLFFAAIGLGFLLTEISLMQRLVLFLGFPTYALSVVLFALLIFTALGSLLSSRWSDPRRGLMIAMAAGAVLIGVGAVGLQPLLRELLDLSFAARVAVSVALLAPLGLVLGMAMPIGLGRLSELHPQGVAWAWGVNGITSVLASVLGVAVAITAGFVATTVLACLCYIGALAHAALGQWPDERAPA
jgi:hypothetical protein